MRSILARIACVAGKYDVANREFDQLGDRYVRSIFPAKDYESFRSWAKDKRPPHELGKDR